MKTITTILVAAAIAAPVPLAFAAETQNSTGTTHASHHDAKFIRDAAEGNAAEIGLAEIAVRKAQNPQVRDYAQQLIRDHAQSNAQLQQIAVANGISWPVAIKKSDARTLDKYENMNGAEFDRSVMNHWVKDHREDIKEYDKAAKHAQDPQVKQFAISTLPTLRQHLNRAEAITSTGVVREPAGATHRDSSGFIR
jgi:putative membrane protein